MEETNETYVIANDDGHKLYNWLTNIYVLVGFGMVYSMIFVFGLVGNLLVGYSVLRDRSKQTVSNVFMSNLAVANILLCIFVVPVGPVDMIVDGWPLGSFMCHLWPCVHYSVHYASLLLLASIAMNRYSVIVHHLRKKMKMRTVIIIVAIIWSVSISASLPIGIFFHYEEHTADLQEDRFVVCFAKWPSMTSSKVYFLTTFVTLLAIPLLVTASFYTALSIKMSTTDCSTQMAERTTNRLLIVMTAVSCVCSMPYHVLQLILLFSWRFYLWQFIGIVVRLVDVIEMSTTCFNPLFYMWLNDVTIKQLCQVGPTCSRHQSHRSYNVNGVDTNGHAFKVQRNEDVADDVTCNAHCDAVNLVSVKRNG